MKPQRTETTEKSAYGFTLTEEELRRIYAIVTQQMHMAVLGNTFITVFRLQFKNQITVERHSVEDVLAETNGREWTIQSLELELYEDSLPPTQILLTFKKGQTETISYHIEGNDRNWVFLTKSLIDDRIRNLKQLNKEREIGVFLFIILVCFSFGIIFFASLFDRSFTISLAPTFAAKLLELFFCAFLIIGTVTYFYFFPSCNFVWGDNIKILERRNSRGRLILEGVLFALLINIASGVFVYFITTK
ncbi:MAG TPA: hypothetical protein VEP90_05010 [Methylomirabilota bacterium]|nr:hypothetical protein [Methylomirabilota bacterium]